ncbi:MAG TPA: signal peptidase I [Bryobacteraceae bacterium]|nr:signal peptidase I [Bryobacteraceae bacterium]
MLPWLKRHVRPFLLVLAGLGLIPAYLRAYKLTGTSDIPTVLLGDKVIVNRAAYSLKLPYSSVTLFRTGLPKRGDFVLLHLPDNPGLRFGFFKRVMGLPGETIEIRENRVIVNGRAIPVEILNPADFAWVPKAHPIGSVVESEDGHWITFTPGKGEHRNHPPVRLSEGEYFVLGDNRDPSLDSREFGPVSAGLLLGKVIATFATGERTR